MKAMYKKLLKIKNPVLIEVVFLDYPSLSRYRILYPDGMCEYSFITSYTQFNRSCFQKPTLEATVEQMEDYDVLMCEIVKIQEIK